MLHLLLSTIGKSRLMSKALVRSIASVAPMFGFDVRYDTKKVRLCNTDGSYKVNPVTGKGVYRRVGKLPNRFFLALWWRIHFAAATINSVESPCMRPEMCNGRHVALMSL